MQAAMGCEPCAPLLCNRGSAAAATPETRQRVRPDCYVAAGAAATKAGFSIKCFS
jgi:hypothetical protein